MKDLKYYMSLPYRFEIIPDQEEGGYGIRYPQLPGCISCGDTIEEVISNGNDAKEAWFAAALEDGFTIAEPSDDEQAAQFKLRLPKCLYRDLSEHAKAEGISINQYMVYLLTKNDTIHTMR